MTYDLLSLNTDVTGWVVNTDNYPKSYAVLLNRATFTGTVKLRTQAAIDGSDNVPSVTDTTITTPLPSELRVVLPPGYRFRIALTAVSGGTVGVAIQEINSNLVPAGPVAFIKLADDTTNHATVQTQYTAIAAVLTSLGTDSGGNHVAGAITNLTAVQVALAAAFGAS